jgi:hypothetical protein
MEGRYPVIPDDDTDGRAPWVTGDYVSDLDPEGAALARRIWRQRQRRIRDGWQHPRGASGHAPRALAGDDALALLDMRAWLDMTEAAGDVIDIEIDHRTAP